MHRLEVRQGRLSILQTEEVSQGAVLWMVSLTGSESVSAKFYQVETSLFDGLCTFEIRSGGEGKTETKTFGAVASR